MFYCWCKYSTEDFYGLAAMKGSVVQMLAGSTEANEGHSPHFEFKKKKERKST